MNEVAQSYADRLAEMNQMIHSLNGYGENLFHCRTGTPDKVDKCEIVKKAIASWYNESSVYDWGYPGFTSTTGHFTQLVWKETSTFGIGIASNSKGSTYVVANYDPEGNYTGGYADNVTNS